MRRLLCLAVAAAFMGSLAQAQSRGELTGTLNLFAVAHLDEVQRLSIRDGVEYCGLFGYDSSGKLAATPARRGERDGCEPALEPEGFEVIASYHTHGAYALDADTEVPSVEDLLADFEEGIDGYIATPGGRIWLNLAEERRSFQLCGKGCVQADPAFRTCPAFLPAKAYIVRTLRQREAEDTGAC